MVVLDRWIIIVALTTSAFVIGWVIGHAKGWKSGVFDAMKANRDIEAMETLIKPPVRARTWRDTCPGTVTGKHEWIEDSANYGGVLPKGEVACQCILCRVWMIEKRAA